MVKVIGLLMRRRVARKDCSLRELAEKNSDYWGNFRKTGRGTALTAVMRNLSGPGA